MKEVLERMIRSDEPAPEVVSVISKDLKNLADIELKALVEKGDNPELRRGKIQAYTESYKLLELAVTIYKANGH